jgi:quinol monooxygenase YgiN
MIIVTARLVFETQQNRDRAVEASTPVQAATRAEEPGCLMYCFAADPAVATEMQVYELWEDPASLGAHFEHPNYLAMAKALGNAGGFLESINRFFVADDRGPVYDEQGKARIGALAG